MEIFTIIAGIIFIVLLREVYCWYMKINEGIDLLKKQVRQTEETNVLLKKLINTLENKSIPKSNYISSSEGVKLDLSSGKNMKI